MASTTGQNPASNEEAAPPDVMSEDEALARKLQDEENAAAGGEQNPLLQGQPAVVQGYPAADPAHTVYRAEAIDPPPKGQPHPNAGVGRFGEITEYNDAAFAVLFMLILGGFVAVCVYFLRNGVRISNFSSKDSIPWLALLLGSAAVAGALCGGWIFVMRKFPKECIMAALVAQISFCLILTVFCFMFNLFIYGFLFMLLTLLLGLYLWTVRDCIPFAAAILAMVGNIMKIYPQCYYLALASIVPQLIIIIPFLIAVIVICDKLNHKVGEEMELKMALFFMAFAVFWASQVIRNIVHMSVAGVAATWYFLSGPGDTGPQTPLQRSLKRACTNSFGSICFGSLLVAFIQTLRFMVRSQNDGFCAICVDCFLSCIESVLAFMNKYAFTYIAVYGGNFCDAGQSVWNLIKERGFDVIINDDLTETVFLTVSIFNGLLCGALVGLIAWSCGVRHAFLLAVVAFVVVLILCLFVLSVMDSGVATLFVCFSEDPGQLESARPDLHAQLKSAWLLRYGIEDWEIRMYSGPPAYR